MTLDDFHLMVTNAVDDNQLKQVTQRSFFHGNPAVFHQREQDFFDFKRRLVDKFQIHPNDIFIVGSAKLGFSPHKGTVFSLDSDIDLAIVSSNLFGSITDLIVDLTYQIRSQSEYLRTDQWKNFNKYLRYSIIGWMRPDLIPRVGRCKDFKDDWFMFFQDLSYGKTEVGNYKVTGGVFQSQLALERYLLESVKQVKVKLEAGV